VDAMRFQLGLDHFIAQGLVMVGLEKGQKQEDAKQSVHMKKV
jgi:hypothetical protein